MSKQVDMRLVKSGKFWTVFGANGCLFMSINMNEALEKLAELRGRLK